MSDIAHHTFILPHTTHIVLVRPDNGYQQDPAIVRHLLARFRYDLHSGIVDFISPSKHCLIISSHPF